MQQNNEVEDDGVPRTGIWMPDSGPSLRCAVVTEADGLVTIKVLADQGPSIRWHRAAEGRYQAVKVIDEQL